MVARFCSLILLVLTFGFPVTAADAQGSLPSVTTRNAIESLDVKPSGRDSRSDFREFKIETQSLPPEVKQRVEPQGNPTAPLIVPNTIVLQFQPNASQEGIDELLKRRNLTVVETFPKLGAVKVEADLSKHFAPDLNDKSANDALLRGVNSVIQDYKSEPIVRSATPDVVLRSKGVDGATNLMKASDVKAQIATAGAEATDWGVLNIEADKLWALPGAQDGALLGVMDVGFSRHEDITFLELPNDTAADDHGNHVAAIGCGRHGNAKGVRGVVPNCFVRAKTGDVFFKSAGDNPTLSFLVVFSQVLASLDRFLDQYDDIKVINLSMGYNWRSNFGINPDEPSSSQWRSLVESQGTILVSALELANKTGKVIFSAAGNDSSGLATPISAKYASPFNWAAFTARERGIAKNGVVVEAHNSSNKRASFSNSGGHVSCPGVDVLSAVAHDGSGSRSETMYGTMSGTSMASPYCASALLLLTLVRPNYTGVELVDCMLASSEKTDAGVPIPKLTQATARCPAKP